MSLAGLCLGARTPDLYAVVHVLCDSAALKLHQCLCCHENRRPARMVQETFSASLPC